MMGVSELPQPRNKKLVPAVNYGVEIISIGFLVKMGQPLIWRGPLLHSTIRQFLVDVDWGDLDYLVVDLPPEEALELRRETDQRGLDFISLIAPTTSEERARQIAGQARGFIYLISITGVTGTARPDSENVKRDIPRIKAYTDIPVVVGFGISTLGQAKEFAPLADGIVIGSAFVRLIDEHAESPDLVSRVSSLAREIKEAMKK